MIDMRKILKKTATLMMTAVIGVSMSCPREMIVYAGHNNIANARADIRLQKNGIIQKSQHISLIYR